MNLQPRGAVREGCGMRMRPSNGRDVVWYRAASASPFSDTKSAAAPASKKSGPSSPVLLLMVCLPSGGGNGLQGGERGRRGWGRCIP